MKSKYQFEKMELDDQLIAVPVGEAATELHAVLNVNEEAMRILELLQEDITEEEIINKLLSEYECTEEKIKPLVHTFIEQLAKEGILECYS